MTNFTGGPGDGPSLLAKLGIPIALVVGIIAGAIGQNSVAGDEATAEASVNSTEVTREVNQILGDARQEAQGIVRTARDQRTEIITDIRDLEGELRDLEQQLPAAQEAAEEAASGQVTTGTYIVGSDIEPGTYRTDGQDRCYYEIRSLDDDRLRNEYTSDGRSLIVVLEPDTIFETEDCGTWTLS